MKIRTVRPISGCVGFYNGVNVTIGHCCLDDCEHLGHRRQEYERFENGFCLSDHIKLDERIFVRLTSFSNGKPNHVDVIAHVTPYHEYEGSFKLVLERRLYGRYSNITPHGHVWVESCVPEPFFTAQDQKMVLTSDGAISIDEGNFLGCKDGELCELTPKEILTLLSKEQSSISPGFSSLRVTPVVRRPRNARTGTLIFNENTLTMEYYNGSEWRTL